MKTNVIYLVVLKIYSRDCDGDFYESNKEICCSFSTKEKALKYKNKYHNKDYLEILEVNFDKD